MIQIVAEDPRTCDVFALARRVARSTLPVLVLGETGTGKEILAHEIHCAGPRAQRPFRAVNCGALPKSLLESVLFGHEKGAFTGAAQAHAGVFEQADGGTLFLDEIGELSPEAQAALLRVLETKTLSRIGARDDRRVDVRVVAATHRDLPALCAAGHFREDLMHRINAVTLVLPPLRERRSDIAPLAEHFLRQLDLPSDAPRTITPAALAALRAYHWPGNIRQLKNVIERSAVLALGSTIDIDDLPDELRTSRPEPSRSAFQPRESSSIADEPPESGRSFRERMQRHEAELVRRALADAAGNRTRAAQSLRMPLRTFMKKLKDYEIVGPEHCSPERRTAPRG